MSAASSSGYLIKSGASSLRRQTRKSTSFCPITSAVLRAVQGEKSKEGDSDKGGADSEEEGEEEEEGGEGKEHEGAAAGEDDEGNATAPALQALHSRSLSCSTV